MKKTRVGVLGALLLAGLLALSACSTSAPSPTKGSLTIGLPTITPISFDPAKIFMTTAFPAWEAVYDTLLRPDGEGGVKPWVATKYAYNDDKTKLTLTLRDDVVFSDGTALDSKVVKANLENFKNGGGGEAIRLAGVSDIATPGKATVVISLARPDPGLLISLSQAAGFLASPASFTAADVATHPVGSGPYILDTAKTVNGVSYAFTRNPGYWGTQPPYDKVTLQSFDSQTALLNALKSGQVNYALLDAVTGTAAKAAGLTLAGSEISIMELTIYDRAGTLNPAFADQRVRQAMNYAIDKNLLLKNFGYGAGGVAGQSVSPVSKGFDPALDASYAYDPGKARELLKEAGYSDLTIQMFTMPSYDQAMVAAITQMYAEVGITIDWTQIQNSEAVGLVRGGKQAVFLFDRWVMFPDWENVTSYVGNEAIWNPFKYQDKTVAKYTDELRHAASEEDFATAAKALNKYIVDQAWYVPIYRVQQQNFTDDATAVKPLPYYSIPSLFNFSPRG